MNKLEIDSDGVEVLNLIKDNMGLVVERYDIERSHHCPIGPIHYWTKHSSNVPSAEVQGAAVTCYISSWAPPRP